MLRKIVGAPVLAIVVAVWVVAYSSSSTADRRGQAGLEDGFSVDSDVALSSLIAVSDGHLQKMADSLELVAAFDEVRSADWERVEPKLAAAAEQNVAALNWFALPDGSYWSVQHGQEEGNLAARAYFPRVLGGETVIGELVVSRATGQPVAIVAVPVLDADGDVVGVLGASVYLDRLSQRIERELGVGDDQIFYSFDDTPLVALVWDPELVFLDPMAAGEPELAGAFREMLERESGTVSYSFRGRERTVVYRRSDVTGWWYAFGIIHETREPSPLPP